jgi:hypothetical protein
VVHNRGLGSEQGGRGWCGAPPGLSLGAVGLADSFRRVYDAFR